MIEVVQTDEFAKWLKRLKNAAARARILVRIQRLTLTENFGDAKPVDDGVFEIRIDCGSGCRLYYALRGKNWSCFSLEGINPRNRETSQRRRS